MKFDARIDGRLIHCLITTDRPLIAPVFCFSGMAPMMAIEGGEKRHGLAGYTEIQLPNLECGHAHRLTIAHEESDFFPANRAWLPLGAYLRCAGETIALPPLPAGVTIEPRPTPPTDALLLRLCPQPTTFTPSDDTLLVEGFDVDGADLTAVNQLCLRTGLGPFLLHGGTRLSVRPDPALRAEGYRLDITPNGITLDAADRAGEIYGSLSLATLRKTHSGSLPCGVIEDAPRFEWRGQHLDCARHFYQVETILRLLDLMALLKLNRFHWHFADDEAFRLELKSLPALAQTHFRGEGELIPGVFGGGIRSGGRYTSADAQRVVAHAKALNIEVMPEIEVPAHALSIARVLPETRDPAEKGREVSVQGYPENVMNPAIDESWRVWEAMAREVASQFPFGVLHLGGDELPPDTWEGSPAAAALKQREGLSTKEDLMGWTMNRLAEILQREGIAAAAWEEAALGKVGIQHDALLFNWSGQSPGLEAARAGYRVVMTPGQHLYFDMAQTPALDDWGANWAAIIGLPDTINWDPVPDDEPQLEDRIAGVQGAFWGEFTTVDSEAEPMIAPRILGLAVMGWQPRRSCDADTLHALAAHYADVFAAMRWRAS